MEYNDPFLCLSLFSKSENLYVRHAHEILCSFVFYYLVYRYVAPVLNELFFGNNYKSLKDVRQKIDYDVHTVSMVQCAVTVSTILPIVHIPTVGAQLAKYYNPQASMASSLAIGYFLWDLYICLKHYKIYGIQFFAHAVGSLYVMSATLKPFCQAWVGRFLLLEASTPFVNINWYIIQLSKTNKGKSAVPLWFNVFNGLCLLSVFFLIRILYGTFSSMKLIIQIFQLKANLPDLQTNIFIALVIMMCCLNFYWFYKMILVARKLSAK